VGGWRPGSQAAAAGNDVEHSVCTVSAMFLASLLVTSNLIGVCFLVALTCLLTVSMLLGCRAGRELWRVGRTVMRRVRTRLRSYARRWLP
jgi:hypothetical protein